MSDVQRALVLAKPDAVRRHLVGRIIARYEAKGLDVIALELRRVSVTLASQHYAEHVERPFYQSLIDFITSGPLVAMVIEGEHAIEAVRAINGATDGVKAAPGTLRGDFCVSNQQNLVHASDSPASAAREIALWFPDLR
ncbi:nucleoside-diphosphate kinase [Propionibacterium cyclohexanicum]|uniref:Nucleoside diphosphate kinase n=1 Tax=Propionibacterium cyclohexanicum TaxID=64702 RepID=A0A1H9SB21_9ACTN|nr:nucleoside-diphosphate kinase [Propionibacterium cyclohexanicum]SER82161.1 nucleoside-diphosphate kinase [Propionibacterium cyclohexanicum]